MQITFHVDDRIARAARMVLNKRSAMALAVMFTFGSAVVYGGPTTVPNEFTAGTVISASEVNENFQALAAADQWSDDGASIGHIGDVVVQGRLSLGTGVNAVPDDFWTSPALAVGAAGLVGTQGAYGLNLTWNGYRSNAGTNGFWRKMNDGAGINDIDTVSSVEMKQGGIYFLSEDIPDTTVEFRPPIRMSILSTGAVAINSLAGAGNAFVCANSSGQLYRSATACN